MASKMIDDYFWRCI